MGGKRHIWRFILDALMNSQLNEMKQRDMQGDALSVPIHATVSYKILEL